MQNFEGKTKKEAFAEQLKNLILSGKLRAGDRLPPERELALRFGISRGSVNQAILDLERAGFIRIVPRKGAFVAEYLERATPETLSAIMSIEDQLLDSSLFCDLMEMRILVECECARLAARRRDPAAIARLHDSLDRVFAATGDEIVDAIFGFHSTIVRSSGNSAYILIFTGFEKLLRSLISAHYSNENELRKNLPRLGELASAVIMGRELAAAELMAGLLGDARDYMNEYLSTKEAGDEREQRL